MRYLTLGLLLLLVLFQYRLWLGDGSLPEMWSQQRKITELQQELEASEAENHALQAEVEDLNSGLEAIEEKARQDLGLIAPGETFYQLVEPRPKETE